MKLARPSRSDEIPPLRILSNADRKYLEWQRDRDRLEDMCPGVKAARQLSTSALKALWDSYDGAETSDPAISGEAVHLVLNERGEGLYCAV